MPYNEAKWKRDTLAHYQALAQIDVPEAAQTAIALAAEAESRSCGGLEGLTKKLRELLGVAEPTPTQGGKHGRDRFRPRP